MTDPDQVATMSDPAAALEAVGHELDGIAAHATGLFDVESALQALIQSLAEAGLQVDAPGALLLGAAYDSVRYRLRFDEGRMRFDPYLHLADETTVPPHVGVQPDEIVERWHVLFGRVTAPVWRSRLGHLLVVADRLIGRERLEVADSTIDAYLSLPPDWGSGLDAIDALRAGLGVAKQYDIEERVHQVHGQLVRAANDSLEDPSPKPGIVLGITQILVDEREAPETVDPVLDRAREAFSASPHNLDHVFAQQLVRASGDDAKTGALWRERVLAWINAAETSDGAMRAHHLQTAVELSVKAQDRELRREATARLQQITLDDLALMGMRTGMVLRGEEIAELVRPVTEAPTWTEALDAFAIMGPPTGLAADNRRIAEEHAKEFVFSALFPKSRVGGDGLVRVTATTDEEKAEFDLAHQETFNLQFRSTLVAEALLRFPTHHELPSVEELTAYFVQSPIVTHRLGAAVARTFHRWWAGDYEGAGFTIAPRLEALVRNLLLAVNEGIYRLQRQSAPGQYPGLGSMLATLREHGLSEDWFRYLHTTLTNPMGWNARNELLHGFFDDVDLVLSALLLQCAGYLALAGRMLAPGDPNPPSEEPGER